MEPVFDSEKPIFQQIAKSIEDDILNGVISEQQQVLSTNKIAAKGINVLVSRGTLFKQRGIGMFVAGGAVGQIKKSGRSPFSGISSSRCWLKRTAWGSPGRIFSKCSGKTEESNIESTRSMLENKGLNKPVWG